MITFKDYDVKIFTDDVEESAIEQIKRMLSYGLFTDVPIRCMHDIHSGQGTVIGFTAPVKDKVVPNVVGVDISCGMYVYPFKPTEKAIDFHALTDFILHNIPSGNAVRNDKFKQLSQEFIQAYQTPSKEFIKQLKCNRDLSDPKRLYRAIGSLGGGNHFLEIDTSEDGKYLYLIVHTGSRGIGKQVADFYQKLARKNLSGWDKLMEEQNRMIAEYKAAGRRSELQEAIKKLHASFKMRACPVPDDLAYLEGKYIDDYLYDSKLCGEWSKLNRRLIAHLIINWLEQNGYADLNCDEKPFESIHNYIGEDKIIRKGAISAYDGELGLIPLNMRDGSLIVRGKGDVDHLYSNGHGSGRKMSRTQAFNTLKLDDFEESMKGIYSETIDESTIDEAPMVYKPSGEVIENLKGNADIVKTIKPIYNFKASKKLNEKLKLENEEDKKEEGAECEIDID